MIDQQQNGRISWQTKIRPGIASIFIGLAISILASIAVVLIARQLPNLELPVTMILGIPVVGLMLILIGVLKYDWLVFVTFCMIGFVRVEPAPFDLLLVVLLAIGLATGKLSPPDLKSRPLV